MQQKKKTGEKNSTRYVRKAIKNMDSIVVFISLLNIFFMVIS